MSDFRIDKITNREGSAGTQIAGISTFSGTSGIVLPSGGTGGRYTTQNLKGYITDSLIAHFDPATYQLNQSSPLLWASTTSNGVVGQFPATTNIPTWNSGGYFTYDGSNDYLTMDQIHNPKYLTSGCAWTIDGWFKTNITNESGHTNTFVSFHSYNGTNVIRWSPMANTSGGMFYDDNSGSDMSGVAGGQEPHVYQYNNNTWVHVTLARPEGIGFQETLVYRNGTQVATANTSSNGLPRNDILMTNPIFESGGGLASIGQEYDGSPTATDFFDGSIGPVSIYNKQLSASEVLANHDVYKVRFGL